MPTHDIQFLHLDTAERSLRAAFPLQRLAYGAFVGNLLTNGVNLVLAVTGVSGVSLAHVALSACISATVLLIYSHALSTYSRGLARVFTVFSWVVALVWTTAGLLGSLLSDEMTVGIALAISAGCAVFWPLARSWQTLTRLDAETRYALRAPFTGVLSLPAMKAYSGLPPMIDFISERRISTYALFLSSTSCFVVASLAVAGAPGFSLLRSDSPTQVLVVIVAVLLAVVFTYLANILRHRAQLSCRVSVADLRRRDPRPNILFLRPFADDQVALSRPRRSILGAVLAFGGHEDTLDDILLDEAPLYGPPHALANPRLVEPPIGVPRQAASDDWLDVVTRYSAEAIAIVLCVDRGPGVQAELDAVIRQDLIHKTLFIFPPRDRTATREMWTQLLEKLHLESPNEDGPAAPEPPEIVGCFVNNQGTLCAYLSHSRSRDAYFATLRYFLRAHFGLRLDPSTALGD